MEFRVEINMNCEGNRLGHIYYNQPERHEIKAAQHTLEDLCREKATELFGDSEPVSERLECELRHLEATDSAFHFLVLKEIAELSAEEKEWMFCVGSGAPFVEYLLGASPINPLPSHYRCETCHRTEFSSDAKDGYDLPRRVCPFCGNELARDGHNCSAYMHQYDRRGKVAWPYYGVFISDGVLEKLQHRLDSRLVYTASKDHIFCDIEFLVLSKSGILRRLLKETGTSNREIPLDDISIWKQVAKEQYRSCILDLMNPEDRIDALKAEQHHPTDAVETAASSIYDLTRIFGLRIGSFTEYPAQTEWNSPAFYTTKDDIFDALVESGFSADKAAIMAHGIGWGQNHWLNQVPSAIVGNMYAHENLWKRHSCLNRLFVCYLLKWYEIHFPKEYQAISDDATRK